MTKVLSSPLVGAFNSISKIDRRGTRNIQKIKTDYTSFATFLSRNTAKLNSVKIPSQFKISRLQSKFSGISGPGGGGALGRKIAGAGALGGLGYGLGNLGGGRGRVRGYKPTFGTTLRSQRQVNNPGQRLSLNSSRRDIASRYARRFGTDAADARFLKGAQGAGRGIRGVPVLGALFTGLDFAEGVSQGESVGKAATGAVASTAGGLAGAKGGAALGAGIGTFIVPGVGTAVGGVLGGLIGGIAGSFGGGYVADRAYEGVTGEKSVEQQQRDAIQKQKLKDLAAKQKARSGDGDGLSSSLTKFLTTVKLFSTFVEGFSMAAGAIGPGTQTDLTGTSNNNLSTGSYPGFDNVERVAPFTTGHVSTYPGAQFGAGRPSGRSHAGQDIADQDPGDPVLATMAGTITEVGSGFRFQRGNGMSQTIGIKHKDGSRSRYVHVLANVSVGQEVKTGQQIGTVSPADVASSPDFPHLHFELYSPDGGLLDPRPYLKSAPSTPSIAPMGTTDTGSSITPDTMGADDRESAPVVTVGDSIAEGVKGDDAGKAKVGANPTQVLDMLKTQDLAGKSLRLSSGISNDTSQLDVVRQQLEYAKSQGVSSVQLMGTSNDREDLAAMNPKLQALAKEFPGLVNFGGGFKSTDLIHPDYSQYRQRLDNLVKSPGLEAQSRLTLPVSNLESYPTYNRTSGTIVVPMPMPSNSGGGTQVMGGQSSSGNMNMSMMGPNQNDVVNSLVKSILLTNLSDT